MSTIEDLHHFNENLRIEGIIRTMYDSRNKLCKDVSEQLVEHFGKLVYPTVIPRNVRLAEATSHGLSILSYDLESSGAKAYMKLAKEFLKTQTKQKNVHRTITTSKEIA